MTPDAPDDEELFTRLVAAYSEARVAGQHLDPEDDPNVPDRLRPRLRPLLRRRPFLVCFGAAPLLC